MKKLFLTFWLMATMAHGAGTQRLDAVTVRLSNVVISAGGTISFGGESRTNWPVTPTLAQVLAAGNSTGTNNLVFPYTGDTFSREAQFFGGTSTGRVAYIEQNGGLSVGQPGSYSSNDWALIRTTRNLTNATQLLTTNAAGFVRVSTANGVGSEIATNTLGGGTSPTQVGLATNAINAALATNANLAAFATNASFAALATNAQLAALATNANLAALATNANLAALATNAQKSAYATNSANAVYATNALWATTAVTASNLVAGTLQSNAQFYATSAGNGSNYVGSGTWRGPLVLQHSVDNGGNLYYPSLVWRGWDANTNAVNRYVMGIDAGNGDAGYLANFTALGVTDAFSWQTNSAGNMVFYFGSGIIAANNRRGHVNILGDTSNFAALEALTASATQHMVSTIGYDGSINQLADVDVNYGGTHGGYGLDLQTNFFVQFNGTTGLTVTAQGTLSVLGSSIPVPSTFTNTTIVTTNLTVWGNTSTYTNLPTMFTTSFGYAATQYTANASFTVGTIASQTFGTNFTLTVSGAVTQMVNYRVTTPAVSVNTNLSYVSQGFPTNQPAPNANCWAISTNSLVSGIAVLTNRAAYWSTNGVAGTWYRKTGSILWSGGTLETGATISFTALADPITTNAITFPLGLTLGAGRVDRAPLLFTSGSLLTNITAGAIEYSNHTFYASTFQVRRSIVLGQNVVTNTTTWTGFNGSATNIYQITMVPNYLDPGKVIEPALDGIYTSANPQTFTLTAKLGTNTILTTVSTAGTATARPWEALFRLTCRATGASGLMTGKVKLTQDATVNMDATNSVAIDTTVTNTIFITMTPSASANSFSLEQARTLCIDAVPGQTQ